MSAEAAALGACCPRTFCESRYGNAKDEKRARAQPSSTVRAPRRRKRGTQGYDAGKKIKGRKRHIIVDTLGLILKVVIHPADIQDRDGAKLVLKKLDDQFPRLEKIWADGGYAGKLVEWAKELGQWVLEIVKRPETAVGFEVLPHRWIVERTFAWLGRFRRLSKDYEVLIETSEAMIRIAMIRLMVRRLGTR